MGITNRVLALALLGGSALVVSSGALAQTPSPRAGVVTPGVSFAPTDQVIVKMSTAEIPDAGTFGRAAGQQVTNVRTLAADTVVLKLPNAQSGAALRSTVAAFASAPGVEWVEPDVRMSVSADRSSEQWDLGPAGPPTYGIDLPDHSGTSSVTVAVVDTGYVTHADLAGQIVGGYDFISDSRIANDGGGRDSDASDPGDWITSRESRRGFFRGCRVDDSSWHGTHVSGTIAALNDGVGINGINPSAKILPIRALGKCGGYTSDITDGVKWAAGLPVDETPANPKVAKVVNLSLGGGGACSNTWQEAVDAVTSVGTTVVVAAGNANVDAAGYSPASCNGVITVASTGQTGDRAYYSNFGDAVDIAAPGGDRYDANGRTILSTLNTGATSPVAGGDTYVDYQGTSMAAPHVAGVASLMLAVQPDLTPADVVQVMQDTATEFPGGSGCAGVCGPGIVNARLAVEAASDTTPTVTTAPTTTTTTTTLPSAERPSAFAKVSPTNGADRFRKTVTLSWEPSDGADEYFVCIDTTVDGSCDSFSSGPYTGTSAKFVGLSSGTTYEWQVKAVNDFGDIVASGGVWSFSTR